MKEIIICYVKYNLPAPFVKELFSWRKRQKGQVYTLYKINWFLVYNKEYLLFLWSIRARYFATIRADGVLARKKGGLGFAEVSAFHEKRIVSAQEKRLKGANALLDVDKFTIDTGISDFSYQHDHYIYGVSKK